MARCQGAYCANRSSDREHMLPGIASVLDLARTAFYTCWRRQEMEDGWQGWCQMDNATALLISFIFCPQTPSTFFS